MLFSPVCIILQRTKKDIETGENALSHLHLPQWIGCVRLPVMLTYFSGTLFSALKEKKKSFEWSKERKKGILNRCKVGWEHGVTSVTNVNSKLLFILEYRTMADF